MKTTFTSSSALSQTLRYQLMKMQTELVARQKETVTGRVADPGIELGATSGRTLSMRRDIERLEGLVGSNGLATARLDATQNAMTQANALAEDLLEALASASSGVGKTDVIRNEASRIMRSLTDIANTNLNGEYLFSGINTDVRPVADYEAPGSPAKAAFDAAFLAKFGFSQNDPAAANISQTDMFDFLDNYVEPQFMGAGWQANWSSASDQRITTRITLSETTDTSITANNDGFRRLMMIATSVSDLLNGPLGEEGRAALFERTTALVGQVISDVASTQALVGIAQNQISEANERIESQVNVFNGLLRGLEGIDPFEASTRVTDLLTQIETSYALTTRIQQLSLLNHLR